MAPHSEVARRGKQQYFVNPTLETDFIVFNTRRHLFADVHLRQAVNYAIDRHALAKTGGAYGATGQQPTDQTLPPSMPGFHDAHIYPFAPNITVARRLAGTTRRTAILYGCNKSPCDEIAQILTTNLAAIGIDVVTKTFAGRALASGLLTRLHEPFDLSLAGWAADSPDAGTFLNPLALGTAAGIPPFDDPRYRAQTRRGRQADRSRPYPSLRRTRHRPRPKCSPVGRYQQLRERGLLLRPSRLPDLPAGHRDGSRGPLHQTLTANRVEAPSRLAFHGGHRLSHSKTTNWSTSGRSTSMLASLSSTHAGQTFLAVLDARWHVLACSADMVRRVRTAQDRRDSRSSSGLAASRCRGTAPGTARLRPVGTNHTTHLAQ